MSRHHPFPRRSGCPISFGLDIFGDRWTLLVLRDLLIERKQRFAEFLAAPEGIATNILAERLNRLQECRLLTRRPDPDDRRRRIYVPTQAGLALLPVLVEMAYWGATHDPDTGASPDFASAYDNDRAGLCAAMRAAAVPPDNS